MNLQNTIPPDGPPPRNFDPIETSVKGTNNDYFLLLQNRYPRLYRGTLLRSTVGMEKFQVKPFNDAKGDN